MEKGYIEDDNSCLVLLRSIFTPDYFKELADMIMYSGKGVNQLGDFNACKTKGLDYVMLNVEVQPQGFRLATVAICSPRKCNTDEHYKGITDKLQEFL